MEVRYEAVSKSFGSTEALAPLDLTSPDGAFLALLGPSGCGKTTALRLLAGLETPTAGRIYIGERDVTFTLEPRDRDIAMVFQSYALYPHMTVADNIAYPLRAAAQSRKAERDERVRKVAELLGIDDLLDAPPRPALGRPAPAGRAGARDHPPAVGLLDGRAAVEPGRAAATADARSRSSACSASSARRRSTSRTIRSRR